MCFFVSSNFFIFFQINLLDRNKHGAFVTLITAIPLNLKMINMNQGTISYNISRSVFSFSLSEFSEAVKDD